MGDIGTGVAGQRNLARQKYTKKRIITMELVYAELCVGPEGPRLAPLPPPPAPHLLHNDIGHLEVRFLSYLHIKMDES
jgi:hypothetical protein